MQRSVDLRHIEHKYSSSLIVKKITIGSRDSLENKVCPMYYFIPYIRWMEK